MCEYCEPFEFEGEMRIKPLPMPAIHNDLAHMCICEDVDGSMCIATYEYPPNIAGPINYCPMCGRKLVSE